MNECGKMNRKSCGETRYPWIKYFQDKLDYIVLILSRIQLIDHLFSVFSTNDKIGKFEKLTILHAVPAFELNH